MFLIFIRPNLVTGVGETVNAMEIIDILQKCVCPLTQALLEMIKSHILHPLFNKFGTLLIIMREYWISGSPQMYALVHLYMCTLK